MFLTKEGGGQHIQNFKSVFFLKLAINVAIKQKTNINYS